MNGFAEEKRMSTTEDYLDQLLKGMTEGPSENIDLNDTLISEDGTIMADDTHAEEDESVTEEDTPLPEETFEAEDEISMPEDIEVSDEMADADTYIAPAESESAIMDDFMRAAILIFMILYLVSPIDACPR